MMVDALDVYLEVEWNSEAIEYFGDVHQPHFDQATRSASDDGISSDPLRPYRPPNRMRAGVELNAVTGLFRRDRALYDIQLIASNLIRKSAFAVLDKIRIGFE